MNISFKKISILASLLALASLVLLASGLYSCRGDELMQAPRPDDGTHSAQIETTDSIRLRVAFTGDDDAHPGIASEKHDGLAPGSGEVPAFVIFVRDGEAKDGATIIYSKLLPFKATANKNIFESAEKIPITQGKKTIYALYYPVKLDATVDIKKARSGGEAAMSNDGWNFISSATTPTAAQNVNFDDFLYDEWKDNEKRIIFPIIPYKGVYGGTSHWNWISTITSYVTDQSINYDAIKAWGHDSDYTNYWRPNNDDGVTNYTGTMDKLGTSGAKPSGDYVQSFGDETRDNCIRRSNWESVAYLNKSNLPHVSLASGSLIREITTADLGTDVTITVPVYRDYARVRVFIAKDADKPIKEGGTEKYHIGLRGVGFVNIPTLAAPGFRTSDNYDDKRAHTNGDSNGRFATANSILYKSVNVWEKNRRVNYAFAVGADLDVSGMSYPEIYALPTTLTTDEAKINEMRSNPGKYQFLAPQYVAPYVAPRYSEADCPYEKDAAGNNTAIRGLQSGRSEFYDSDDNAYAPRILLATYYADKDTSKYTLHKDLKDPIWHYWVPFGEKLAGAPAGSRAEFCGDVLPGRTYDVFIIVPSPNSSSMVTPHIKVVVKPWTQKNITIPTFE